MKKFILILLAALALQVGIIGAGSKANAETQHLFRDRCHQSTLAQLSNPLRGPIEVQESCARDLAHIPLTGMPSHGRFDNEGHGIYCFEAKNTSGHRIHFGRSMYVSQRTGQVKTWVPSRWYITYCTDGFSGAWPKPTAREQFSVSLMKHR